MDALRASEVDALRASEVDALRASEMDARRAEEVGPGGRRKWGPAGGGNGARRAEEKFYRVAFAGNKFFFNIAVPVPGIGIDIK